VKFITFKPFSDISGYIQPIRLIKPENVYKGKPENDVIM